MSEQSRHLLDFSGTAVASFLATAADALVFAALIMVGPLFLADVWAGMSALAAAAVGGVIHFSLCRFWVFERFDAPLNSSIPRYVFMSGLAAVFHGLATQGLVSVGLVEGVAWFGSKAVIYVAWTYPISRYVVFDVSVQEAS